MQSKMKLVYAVSEGARVHSWKQVGVGFVNRDGSISLKLRAFPVNGEIQVRDLKEEQVAPTQRSFDRGQLTRSRL